MPEKPIQPIFILPENTRRTEGRDAQRLNITAAKLVAETVRTTLGPKGRDKMIVDGLGEVTITNDGVTILNEMRIEHPTAKMIVEIAKTQESEVGDGTTTAVVLAGEFLKQAEGLLEQDIHPTVIARGYRLAAEKALDVLHGMAEPVTVRDANLLKRIALTAMTGKGAEAAKEYLSDLVISAALKVGIAKQEAFLIDKADIKIERREGGTVEDSELIEGIVLDKEKAHSAMPREVKDAKIALIDASIEIKGPETDSKVSITDPSKLQAFLDYEENLLKSMVDGVAKSGAGVVFCQKGIDDVAPYFLSQKGLYACRRVKKSDMERLAKATGATIVSNLHELKPAHLGRAGLVEEIKFGDDAMTFVRRCPQAKAVTILVRGSTQHIVDEIRRSLEDALGDLCAALSIGKVLGGAGAPEAELARRLAKYADSLSGREQLAVQAFARAMETIPRTLAENAGLDPIDVMTELRAAHDTGQKFAGIDVFSGKIMDAWAEGVIEPLRVKTQAVSSAAEVATMILRIDDVILGAETSQGHNVPPSPSDGLGM